MHYKYQVSVVHSVTKIQCNFGQNLKLDVRQKYHSRKRFYVDLANQVKLANDH